MTTTERGPGRRGAGPGRSRRALVTDAARGSAIAVIRSLDRAGWDVLAADESHSSPGFYSRHTASRLVYPPPLRRPDETAAVLLKAVRRRGVGLVVPVTDEVILAVRTMRPAFEAATTLAIASDAALDLAASKTATLELARDLGIPVPRSRSIATPGEADEAARELGWPLVVKPQRSRSLAADGTIARNAVWYATDVPSVVAALGDGPLFVQEFVTGEGHGVELLLRHGELVAAFQHRRLREVPVTGGASSFRESVPVDPALLRYSLDLLRAIDWTGLAMVEFRVGPAGARLMEVNGRIWGSLPLAVACGVDFPALMADVYRDPAARARAATAPASPAPTARPSPSPLSPGEAAPLAATSYPIGVTSRSFPLEVAWIGTVLLTPRPPAASSWPRRREAVIVALRLLSPSGWDVQSLRDPLPGIAEVVRVVLGALGRFRRRPLE